MRQRRDPGLAVYVYSFALDASDLKPPRLLQHPGFVTPTQRLRPRKASTVLPMRLPSVIART